MKNINRILTVFIILSMLFINYVPIVIYASNDVNEISYENVSVSDIVDSSALSYNDYLYLELPDDTVSIYKYNGQDETVVIPESIDGKAVTQLSQEAFAQNDKVSTLIVPESVNKIDNSALYHCENLTALVLCSDNISFGFTIAEGCDKLSSIYVTADFDAVELCALLVNDLGEDKANAIEIIPCDDIDAVVNSFTEDSNNNSVLPTQEDNESLKAEAIAPSLSDVGDGVDNDESTQKDSSVLYSGICGENLTWQIYDNGVLRISGTGSMTNYCAYPEDGNSNIAPWREHSSLFSKLLIDEGVTTIGECAFFECVELAGNLVIPNSVTTIGASAFEGCGSFTGNLVIPDSVTTIGAGAFLKCIGFDGTLTLSKGLTEIGNGAFIACNGFTENLVIPNSVTTIGDWAFGYCSGFTGNLVIPKSVTTIGNYAFSQCSFTGDLVIPNSVTKIGDGAFNDCSGFDGTLTLSESLKKIGDNAFDGCHSFTGNLVIPNSVTTIGDWAFRSCSGFTGNLVIPNSVTTIGYWAFGYCRGFTGNLVIPDSVTTIGDGAFYDCSGFTGDLVIPNSVTTIGNDAFDWCSGFTGNLVIPNSVNTIGDGAFDHCSGFTGNLVIPNSVTTIGNFAFNDCSGFTGNLVIPNSVTTIGYAAFSDCSGFAGNLAISNSVTTIGDFAFSGCSGFAGNLVIPNSVTTIGYAAFQSCSGFSGTLTLSERLKEISDFTFNGCRGFTGNLVIPNSVTTIGERAFYNCRGFTGNLVLPNSVTVIGDWAFYNCRGFTGNLVLPNSVTVIGDWAFYSCSGFNGTLTLSESLTEIGYSAFRDCSGFTGNLVIPNSVTTIGDWAFGGCNGFTGNLVIPNSVTTIGDWAFSYCSGFTGDLVIPNSVTTIGDWAFDHCSGFTGNLVIPNSVTAIGYGAFSDCSGFTGNLVLPNSVTAIGDGAFDRCSGFTGNLVIPDNVTTIGRFAFEKCSGFNGTLTLSNNLKSIGEGAFGFCSGFTGTLTIPASVSSIGVSAFDGCIGFTGSLVLPDCISQIDRYTFRNCSGLTGIVFGSSLTNLVYTAFTGCSGVNTITFLSNDVPIINTSISATGSDSSSVKDFLGSNCFNNLSTVYAFSNCLESYENAWKTYAPSNVKFLSLTPDISIPNLTKEYAYSHSIGISWTYLDDDKIVGYKVYRDGVLVGDTEGNSFEESGLDADTAYTYSVAGYTEYGEMTGEAAITINTVSPSVLDLYVDNKFDKLYLSSRYIYAKVKNDDNLKDAAAKFYYKDKNGEKLQIGENLCEPYEINSEAATYRVEWNLDDIASSDYTVIFEICDKDGESSQLSKVITVDTTLPEALASVVAVGDTNQIVLTWSIASEINTTSYHIYRRSEQEDEFTLIQTINSRKTLTYTDTAVNEGVKYYYYVVGVDEFGQEGAESVIVAAMPLKDAEAPIVTKLTPANGSYLTGKVNLTLTAQDNVFVTKSELYYSNDDGKTWILISQSNNAKISTSFDTTTLPDGVIKVKGVAYDAEGNQSDALVYVYSIDNTGPEQVTELKYTATSVTVTLGWNDVSDNDISFFRVELKNSNGSYSKVTDVSKTLGANIKGLIPDTAYTYRVVGYDIHNNRGKPSSDITVRTLEDTTMPVITRIRPTSNYYSSSIALSVTATDEYNVKRIILQSSIDGNNWNNFYSKDYTDVSKSRTLDYTLSLDGYDEGYLYIRAIAVDSYDNESDSSSSAPFVQYMVDKTAPAEPTEVKANGNNGYIEISWKQGDESDLNTYSVYRSTTENSGYKLISSGLTTINYFDRSVSDGVTYFYKVRVNDKAGNQSDFSEVVSAQAIPDTESPEIVSVYPEENSKLGAGYNTISVLVKDNSQVSSVKFEYRKELSIYSQFSEVTGIKANSKNVTASIPINKFDDGDTVYIRVTAYDSAGNSSDSVVKKYTIDKVAPVVASAYASYDDESVLISWNGLQEGDLIGYRVYRRTGTTGSYSLISQRQAVAGNSLYSCYDYNISVSRTVYYYKIEAVDSCGNTSSIETTAVEIPDRSAPKAVITCDSTLEVGVEYVIDASSSSDNTSIVSYEFNFGDGTISNERKVVHKYDKPGTYTISLTVTDEDGNKNTATQIITVKERNLVGTAEIRVIDENGATVPNAPVYFDLGEENQVIKLTDSRGYVTFTSSVGRHTVGCVIADNEWLPVKKDIIITSNQKTSVTMTLVHHTMIEGQFEITRMTFDEIVAAGIDVSKPENQYIVHVNVALTYGEQTINTSFKYNETTGQTIAKPTIVNTSDGQKRQIIPVVISAGNVNENNADSNPDYKFSSEATIAYLDIPIGVSSLKEFFNVDLHIINNASADFSMLDNLITLNIPDGLTLITTASTENSNVVSINEIKGQTTTTLSWILRGDKIGEYFLSADYSGILSEFNEAIRTTFVATEPIKVCGLSNLKLRVEIPEELEKGTFYYNLSLINVGREDVYRPRVETDDVLIEAELFDATGANIADTVDASAAAIDEFGLATDTDGNENILRSGERLTKHYMCVDQTQYTDKKLKLQTDVAVIKNTYGLECEYVVKPLNYFTAYLDTGINSMEKADLTYTANQSAYEYLMNNENYIYWNLYASTGDVKNELPTNGQERLWNLLKFGTGNGNFKSLFGADDNDLIKEIIIDAMELSAETNEYKDYQTAIKWLKKVMGWLSKTKPEEIFIDTASYTYDCVTAHTIISDTISKINKDYKWEMYKNVILGEQQDFNNFIIEKLKKHELVKDNKIPDGELYMIWRDTISCQEFKLVWTGLGIGLTTASSIVTACKNTEADISLAIMAQSNIDKCNLFLDAIIDNVPKSKLITAFSDANKVIDEAKKIKEFINDDANVWQTFIKNFGSETFWKGLDFAKKITKQEILKALDLTMPKFVKVIKKGLSMTVKAADNIFNISERYALADKIRFVSIMSIGMEEAITKSRNTYLSEKTDENAYLYLQHISYLLKLREIGESEVAKFGESYEVLKGVYDSEELFLTVKNMSGAESAVSWEEWRDYVEDKITLVRVQLLKKPLQLDEDDLFMPAVTFNYAAEETVQTFSDEYEYSLDKGKTWTNCNNSPIHVQMQPYSITLQVRRKVCNNTNEKLTKSLTIWGIPSLSCSDIIVKQTASGYCIENLDNSINYEVNFSDTAKTYAFGESLSTAVPKGSYSYEVTTDKEYSYVYIRSVADCDRYASYVYCPIIHPLCRVSVECTGSGVVSGSGLYKYGDEVILVATPSEKLMATNWYENGNVIGKGNILRFNVYENRIITADFVKSDHNCYDCVDEWIVDKESSCTKDGSKHGYCSSCDAEIVELIPASGHDAGDWILEREPTLLSGGCRVKKCKICGHAVETEIIDALTDDSGWRLCPSEGIITGISERTSAGDVIAHYGALGMPVTVTDATGKCVETVGTGCLLNVDGEIYTIIVLGDVTGDGGIDIFDIFAMLDHTGEVKQLTGSYFKAGCYLGNDDIDIFDIFAMLDYVIQS